MTGTDKEIENPPTGHEFRFFGHRFRILQSARRTEDGSLRFEYFAPPRANIPEHVHLRQEEQFEVVSGTLGIRVGGREMLLEAGRSAVGRSAVGPAEVSHAWWNPGEEEVCFVVGIRPGLEVETMLETLLGLMRDGKTIGVIPKNPLRLAVLVREVGGWAYSPRIPKPARKALFAPVAALAFVGGRLGYKFSHR